MSDNLSLEKSMYNVFRAVTRYRDDDPAFVKGKVGNDKDDKEIELYGKIKKDIQPKYNEICDSEEKISAAKEAAAKALKQLDEDNPVIASLLDAWIAEVNDGQQVTEDQVKSAEKILPEALLGKIKSILSKYNESFKDEEKISAAQKTAKDALAKLKADNAGNPAIASMLEAWIIEVDNGQQATADQIKSAEKTIPEALLGKIKSILSKYNEGVKDKQKIYPIQKTAWGALIDIKADNTDNPDDLNHLLDDLISKVDNGQQVTAEQIKIAGKPLPKGLLGRINSILSKYNEGVKDKQKTDKAMESAKTSAKDALGKLEKDYPDFVKELESFIYNVNNGRKIKTDQSTTLKGVRDSIIKYIIEGNEADNVPGNPYLAECALQRINMELDKNKLPPIDWNSNLNIYGLNDGQRYAVWKAFKDTAMYVALGYELNSPSPLDALAGLSMFGDPSFEYSVGTERNNRGWYGNESETQNGEHFRLNNLGYSFSPLRDLYLFGVVNGEWARYSNIENKYNPGDLGGTGHFDIQAGFLGQDPLFWLMNDHTKYSSLKMTFGWDKNYCTAFNAFDPGRDQFGVKLENFNVLGSFAGGPAGVGIFAEYNMGGEYPMPGAPFRYEENYFGVNFGAQGDEVFGFFNYELNIYGKFGNRRMPTVVIPGQEDTGDWSRYQQEVKGGTFSVGAPNLKIDFLNDAYPRFYLDVKTSSLRDRETTDGFTLGGNIGKWLDINWQRYTNLIPRDKSGSYGGDRVTDIIEATLFPDAIALISRFVYGEKNPSSSGGPSLTFGWYGDEQKDNLGAQPNGWYVHWNVRLGPNESKNDKTEKNLVYTGSKETLFIANKNAVPQVKDLMIKEALRKDAKTDTTTVNDDWSINSDKLEGKK